MKSALALELLGLAGCATSPGSFERYALSDGLPSALDAHSRAANLQPLKPSAEDELRVWIHGYMATWRPIWRGMDKLWR